MGLANLAFHTAGINAYEYFLEDREPDWGALWEQETTKAAVFFIAYNGVSVDLETHEPDWPKLRRLFTKIVLEVPFEYRRQLAFGVLYAKETEENVAALLETEFDDFFVPLLRSHRP